MTVKDQELWSLWSTVLEKKMFGPFNPKFIAHPCVFLISQTVSGGAMWVEIV